MRPKHDWRWPKESGSYELALSVTSGFTSNSSILAWRIPGTEEPSGLPSMGSHRVGHDWSDLAVAVAAAAEASTILVFQCWVLSQLFHSPPSPSSRGYLVPLGFWHKGGVICISEVIDYSSDNPDSSLCFIHPSIVYVVLILHDGWSLLFDPGIEPVSLILLHWQAGS